MVRNTVCIKILNFQGEINVQKIGQIKQQSVQK